MEKENTTRENLEILNKTLKNIKVVDDDYEQSIYFLTEDNRVYIMTHKQECCEEVYIDDISGNINDLVGSPLNIAEVYTKFGDATREDSQDYETYTFYRFATNKGYLDIRWYGTSNGCYSETADFFEIKNAIDWQWDEYEFFEDFKNCFFEE